MDTDKRMPRILLVFILFALGSPLWAAEGDSLEKDPGETWGWRTAMITSLMLTLATNPLEADEFSVTTMSAPDVAGIKTGFRWFPEKSLGTVAGLPLTHYYQFAYSYWQDLDVDGQEGVNNVLEFSPVFRFNWGNKDWLSYMETSVGASVFSRTELGGRQFSTNFQFVNSLAFGGYFTKDTSWSLQLQHYSNNSIKLPNNGINFYNFVIAHRY